MDQPLVGRADLGERRTLGGRAEPHEFERVSRRPAIAGKVHDDIAERRSLVEHEGVVAAVADEHIRAKTAIEHVVAGISVEIVGGIIAGAVEISAALQHQRLHARREPAADDSEHHVSPLAGGLVHLVGRVVDEIRIVAGAAGHGVGAGTAVEQVVAAVAEQRVGEIIAVALQVGAALQHQRLNVRREPEVGGGEDRIAAFIGVLHHRVAGIVDEIGIASGAAEHDVGAGAAIDEIVAAIAIDDVRRGVAVALQVGAPLHHQGFHIRRQSEMGAREHRVRSLAGVLDHRIAGIVDEVDIVAGAAEHRIGAGAAVEQVAPGIAIDRVAQAVAVGLQVGASLQDQGLHVRRQPEMGGRIDRVGALARVLVRLVADIVDKICIVAGTACEHVGSAIAREHVVVRAADDVLDAGEHVALRIAAGADTGQEVHGHAGGRQGIIRGIRAEAAHQGVGAGAAVERVVPGAAEQHVVAAQPAQNVGLVGGRHHRRQPEDLAVEIGQIEIAARVFAERRRIGHGADIGDDLRGAVGRDPRGAIEAQGEDLALREVGEEILPLQRFRFSAIDITAGDRLPHAVVIGVDRRDRGSAGDRPALKDSGPSNAGQP